MEHASKGLRLIALFKIKVQYPTECPKNLETMGILIIFLIIICRLKLKVKRLKMALTLDERVEIVLLSGPQGWTQRQVEDEFNARHPERNPITQRSGETW
jgi:hypothetical protein